jgi:glycosyltransferase involved in cell wall biosynthesis
MNLPTVSLIIPTHNRPQLLREALASVRNQFGVSFEVIVVNDAGADVSDFIDEFKAHLPLTEVVLTENAGLPAARNAGIAKARGRYIAYLDDDDVLLPNHLGRLAKFLDANPETGLVYTDALLLRQRIANGRYRTFERRVLAYDYDYPTMLRDSFICPSSVMHRRECLERVGGFDEMMRWCYEDWDFFLKIAAAYQIERAPGVSVLIRLREGGGNMSGVLKPERMAAAQILTERYGVGKIEPKTFWEVAQTLEDS